MARLTVDLRMYRHSGIGRYLRNLLPPLLPLLHADRIRVLATEALLAGAPWLTDPRIELHPVSAPIYSPQELALPLTSALAATDLLWVPHFNGPPWYRGAMAITMHDIGPIAVPQILSSPLKRAYARLLIQRAISQAAAILCVSSFTAGELMHRLHTPPEKIHLTPPGLDAAWPHTATPHVEADGLPYFLFVGNVKPNKNLKLLIEAFSSVLNQLPHRLLIVGRISGMGTTDHQVITQAESFGDRVRFVGEVSDSDLIAHYAGAAAFVFPSLYEGFGLPILEAMQLGCPVFASSAASLPEVAGNAALYFDPHNAASLATALLAVRDSVRMDQLRLAGRERVSHFSFATCAAQTAAALNPLLSKSNQIT